MDNILIDNSPKKFYENHIKDVQNDYRAVQMKPQ